MDISQTTTTTRAPLAVLISTGGYTIYTKVSHENIFLKKQNGATLDFDKFKGVYKPFPF